MIMRTQILSKPKLSFLGKPRSLLQRKCDHCEKKGLLQRRAVSQSDPDAVPPIVHEVLRLPGQPLDAKTRASMETRFGYDFSRTPLHSMGLQDFNLNLKIGSPNDVHEQNAKKTADRIMQPRSAERNPLFRSALDFSRVRVHTDSIAAESAMAINALAYTVGPHIVFGSGEYSPDTDAGQKVLAHELAHVVQQTSLGELSVMGTMIQRIKIENCYDQAHEKWISDEHTLAYSMLQDAYMSCWNFDPKVQAAFWRHFRICQQDPDFQNLWYQVLWVIYYMLQYSPQAEYKCEPNWWDLSWKCNTGKILAHQDDIFSPIEICHEWWPTGEGFPERAAGVFIHEWAHKWGLYVHGNDETYCSDSKYKTLTAKERIRQPDAYQNFAIELKTNILNDCFV